MSASRIPTRCPWRLKAAARLAVSDDLPTPPLPLATAITRVERSSEMPCVRSVTPPRSFVVSAAFSSGDMTSNSSATRATPPTGARARATCSSKLARSGQPATVSAIVTTTSPPSIRTSRIMSSSTTLRRSSGSITCFSASRISSRFGSIAAEGTCASDPQALLQPEAVADRKPFPVVVEVGVDVDGGSAPLLEPLRPRLELGAGVVAALSAGAGVEADERPVGRQLARLERPLWVVADHERDAALAEHLGHLRNEPAFVTELEAVAAGR